MTSRQVKLALIATTLTCSLGTPAPALAQETVEYYGLDALGSVRVIFDEQGNVVDRMDYGPFGDNLKAAIKFPVEQFAQLARDAESEHDYAKLRNYSWRAGRFNRPDPLRGNLHRPQSLNRYAYASNCPESRTDPSGGTDHATRPFHVGVINDIVVAPYRDLLRGGGGSGDDTFFALLPDEPNEPTPGGGQGEPGQGSGDTSDPPNDDCEQFSEELTSWVKGASYFGPRGVSSVGAGMFAAAGLAAGPIGVDLWKDRPVRGFRTELIDDQGSDVYRHVVGHAGAVLSMDPALLYLSKHQVDIDIQQRAEGKLGARAEVLGDFAGLMVGNLLRGASASPLRTDWRAVTAQIVKVLCK